MVRPVVRLFAFAAVVVLALGHSLAQPPAGAPGPPTPYRTVLDSLKARCIGPANMGGRITDLAVVESDPNTFYVAAAGGGVWKTTDGGDTFAPVFDAQPTQCIGAVAVCQAKPEVVYVGTGEANPRNSVSWGKGVFRSTDGGKTWANCGLAETHHIGRVVVHPTDPDTAYVAALGHVWGPNPERGLYKTTDGGKTWTHALKIDETTGVIDVAIDPSDPKIVYAAAWAVKRDAFSGGNPKTQTGPNGGLFKSTDGGKTWDQMTDGLPDRNYGRCGLSVSRKDPNVVYAVVQTDKTSALTNTGQVAKEGGPADSGGIFRSADKGKTWQVLNQLCPRPFYYGQIRADHADADRVYVLGVGFSLSTDGGKNFRSVQTGVHSDLHALWINPKDEKHLVLGTDGGVYVSKDQGKTWAAKRGLVAAQFYGVAVDMRTPYRVYGGLQDNGTWGGPSATPYADGITLADWRRIGTADGFQVAVDPTDADTVYFEIQYGGLTRGSLKGGKLDTKKIKPAAGPEKGQPGPPGVGVGVSRFNWNTPFFLSPHDPKMVYAGGQAVFRSSTRGDTWGRISSDLTRAGKGPAPVGGRTILALAESPVKAGVLWAGTDDGNLWVNKTGRSQAWADVSRNVEDFPLDRAISKIECDALDAGTAYVAVDRHRNDDYNPYLFKAADYGDTFEPIHKGLPAGAVIGVVRQSSKNPKLLFVGTELGLYTSPDGGKTWHHLNKTGLPANVRIDDLVIHPRERELVIGTHGRGIWIMDIAPLEQLTEEVLAAPAHLFAVKPTVELKTRPRPAPKDGVIPPKAFVGTNPAPGVPVTYLVKEFAPKVEVTVTDKAGKVVASKSAEKVTRGLHTLAFPVPPGEYTVTFKAGSVTRSSPAVVTKEGESEPKEKD